nr:VTT domain-containing protein [Paenibacillus roseus]
MGILIVYLLLVAVIIVYKDELLSWAGSRDTLSWWPLLWVIAVLLTLVPFIPYGAVASLMGIKFGFLTGLALSFSASVAGSVLMFVFFRMLMGDAVRPYLSRYRYLDHFTVWFERQPFISLLMVRLIPVIPAQAVNLYCSASNIPLLPFALATAIGKIPMIAVFVLAGDQLLDKPVHALLIFSVYVVLLIGLMAGYRYCRRAGMEKPKL